MINCENCLVIAGEKSGEEHFLSFLPQLRQNRPELTFWGVGGDDFSALGIELLYHLRDFSSWGYTEVLSKIPFYFKALKTLEAEVVRRNCKMAILIDFQDFNMRLAKRLVHHGVKVYYYVAPQAWAWKSWRAKVLARTVETLFAILPFEKEWFLQRGVKQVVLVENPVLTRYKSFLPQIEKKECGDLKQIVLLPGSRKFEVRKLLPIFLQVATWLQSEMGIKIVLVRSASIDSEWFSGLKDVQIVEHEELPKVLLASDLALAASGTVTLTTALFRVPTIVAYHTSYLNEYIFNTFVQYKGPISLPNIILKRMVFPELLQDGVSEYEIKQILLSWIRRPEQLKVIDQQLQQIRTLLAGECDNVGKFLALEAERVYG